MSDPAGALWDAVLAAFDHTQEQEISWMIFELRTAAIAAQLQAIAAGAIPVAAMAGVWVALGSGYLGAKQLVKKEKFAQGYSRGFVMGLLSWNWNHAVSRFGISGVLHTNHFDESLDEVGTSEYLRALAMGFKVAGEMSNSYKESYLRGLKTFSSPRKGDWSRNDQISYVIELSTAYRKHFMRL
jgi:hypothetical protein